MNFMIIKLKPFMIWFGTALISAGITGFIILNNTVYFESLLKPSFAPTVEILSLAFMVSHIFLGISAYMISVCDSQIRRRTLLIYVAQLILTVTWPGMFFVLNNISFSMIWLSILLIVLVFTTVSFYFASLPQEL